MNNHISKSQKRFIQSQKVIFSILLIITILSAISLSVNAYTINDYWLCKGVDESSNPYKPIDPTAVFYDTDERVYVLLVLEYVTASHNIIIKWYDPEDSLLAHGRCDDTLTDPRSEGYDYWTNYSYSCYLTIKDGDAADLPGQWRIEVYIDGKKEFTENFEIRATTTTTTTPEPTVTNTSIPTTTASPIVPEEEMTPTLIVPTTSDQEEENIGQSSFLSNPMILIIIALAVIIVMLFIILAKRKKPITPSQIGVSNKYCMNCGKLVGAEETFCGSCGEKLE